MGGFHGGPRNHVADTVLAGARWATNQQRTVHAESFQADFKPLHFQRRYEGSACLQRCGMLLRPSA